MAEPASARQSLSARDLLCAVALAGLAAAVRVVFLNARGLWFDETFSVFITALPWQEAWRTLRERDPHPILYYLLLRAWVGLGRDPIMVRTLSVAFGSLSVLVVTLFATRIGGRRLGTAAGLVVASSALAVSASVEARMYALLGFLVVLATWLLWEGVHAAGRTRAGMWVAFAGTLALALHTDYFALLVLMAYAVYIAVCHGHDEAVRVPFVTAVAASLALFAPWVPVAAEQYGKGLFHTVWKGSMPAVAPADVVAMSTFGGYFFGWGSYLVVASEWAWRAVVPVVPFLALVGVGLRTIPQRDAAVLLGVTWTVPVLSLIAVSLVTGANYAIPRYTSFVYPFFAMVLAQGISGLVPRRWRVMPLLVVSGVVGLALVNLAALRLASVDNRHRIYNWAEAARHVRERLEPGDALLFYPPPGWVAFGYYFTEYYARPAPQSIFVLFSPSWTDPRAWRGWAETMPPFRQLVKDARRVWIVITRPIPPGTGQAVLDRAARDYRLVHYAEFRDPWVFLYERRRL